MQALRFFNADPQEFDIVFVANATAAIKLVADAFRDHDGDFWYGVHSDAHTSLVGVRELAKLGSVCFRDDADVQNWIDSIRECEFAGKHATLFAYPGQSNMTGRRLPYNWCEQIRSVAARTNRKMYTLFDAAALATTAPLDFSNADAAPDFTALSFYKIFGFPDLGALIVRKASGDILRKRKYFGGGTVDVVAACSGASWHMRKESLHSALEDGTLPFHNIVALNHAIKTHYRLYGSMAMQNISAHTAALRNNFYDRMSSLKHSNGKPVCKMHSQKSTDTTPYGPVIAFNLLDSSGGFVSNSEIEKMGIVKNIQFRTGGLCNPGGVAKHFNMTADDLKRNYAAGVRCGSGKDTVTGHPTGSIRVSLGAMSSQADVDRFIEFLDEFYVSHEPQHASCDLYRPVRVPRFSIESMSIFPIKSCSAFKIPTNIDWEVSEKGLAWDRDWCLLHQGTNAALSQKQHPRMALIQPSIDMKRRSLDVSYDDDSGSRTIHISLDDLPSTVESLDACQQLKQNRSTICGESVAVHTYTSSDVKDFFSEALGVPCTLARYFNDDTNVRLARLRRPKSNSASPPEPPAASPSIKLANESPILLVSRSSVNRLNEQIRQRRSIPQEISSESFRANIIVSEQTAKDEPESPYIEDTWRNLSMGGRNSTAGFDVLGPCQRCQMVCVDQASAKRRQEPFSTLAKTRRWDGGVWFGVHLSLSLNNQGHRMTLRAGDPVIAS